MKIKQSKYHLDHDIEEITLPNCNIEIIINIVIALNILLILGLYVYYIPVISPWFSISFLTFWDGLFIYFVVHYKYAKRVFNKQK